MDKNEIIDLFDWSGLSHAFYGMRIPDYMHDGLKLYVENGRMPGSFLQAVLENDLRMAVMRADGDNIRNIPAYISFLYTHAPSQCWGSPKNVREWIKRGGLRGNNT